MDIYFELSNMKNVGKIQLPYKWDFLLSKSLISEYNCVEKMLFNLLESEYKGRLTSWSWVCLINRKSAMVLVLQYG